LARLLGVDPEESIGRIEEAVDAVDSIDNRLPA
jgi:hypothetical protein